MSNDPFRNLADWFVEQMRKPSEPAEEASLDAFEAERVEWVPLDRVPELARRWGSR